MATADEIAAIERAINPPWRADLFAAQQEVFDSSARFKSVTTSRRGGKTVLLTGLAGDALARCAHDECVVYLAKTRQIAKDLIWGKLKGFQRRYQMPWEFREQELRIDTPTGGFLLIRGAIGADPDEELDKLRGLKLRRALADEPATYAPYLGRVLADAIEPALGDLRGDVIVSGTPGEVCAGPWYEISTGVRKKWRCHRWTVRDNSFFRDADSYLREALEENGWDEENARYRREYLGEWVVDDSATVYRYVRERNTVTTVPGYDRSTWVHTVAVDFGMVDESAWVVLASHPHSQDIYVVAAFKRANLLPEQAAEITRGLVERYNPYVLVGDAGGLGKPYVEAYNRRFNTSLQMLAAEKTEKRAFIELLNGDLRTSRLRILISACQELCSEIEILPWEDPALRLREHPAYANHACDALLYGWRHHHAYLHRAPPPRAVPDEASQIAEEERQLSRQSGREWWDQ